MAGEASQPSQGGDTWAHFALTLQNPVFRLTARKQQAKCDGSQNVTVNTVNSAICPSPAAARPHIQNNGNVLIYNSMDEGAWTLEMAPELTGGKPESLQLWEICKSDLFSRKGCAVRGWLSDFPTVWAEKIKKAQIYRGEWGHKNRNEKRRVFFSILHFENKAGMSGRKSKGRKKVK